MLGQRLQKQIGQTGIPVYNVVNACATGATAVRVAMMGIKSAECDTALAVGVEKMGKMGLLGGAAKRKGERKVFTPSGRYDSVVKTEGLLGTGLMPGVFAQAGMEYALKHGVTAEQFAKVAQKNHAHSVLNPLAQYRKEFSLEEILQAEVISYPNTLPMCCPTGDGASALVLASAERLAKQDDPIPCKFSRHCAQGFRQIPSAPGVVMSGCGGSRAQGSAQVEAQDRPALADEIPRARHHRAALLRACEAMYEHDKRPGHGTGRPVKPRRQPVAAGDLKQQALAARQVRRSAAKKIAQSLQITPKPGRPFVERRNRPSRHVVAILHGRGSPIWHMRIHQIEAVLLRRRALRDFP